MNKGTRLERDWVLPDEWRQDAEGIGLEWHHIRNEAAKFRDYWVAKPGQAGCKLDWRATWRNWCRKAYGDLPTPARAPAREVTDITSPERSQNYHTIAAENLAAMRGRTSTAKADKKPRFTSAENREIIERGRARIAEQMRRGR